MPVAFNDFPKFARETSGKVRTVVSKATNDIRARAAQAAPVDTGNLKASILTGGGAGAYERTVFVAAEYGRYVEFGTSKMGAQPYFMPAVEAVKPAFYAALAVVMAQGGVSGFGARSETFGVGDA